VYAAIPDDDGTTPRFPELANGGGIVAVCTTEAGDTVETVLTSELRHCVVPDVMMMVDELALTQLPEVCVCACTCVRACGWVGRGAVQLLRVLRLSVVCARLVELPARLPTRISAHASILLPSHGLARAPYVCPRKHEDS
jgi:hypothetical protein